MPPTPLALRTHHVVLAHHAIHFGFVGDGAADRPPDRLLLLHLLLQAHAVEHFTLEHWAGPTVTKKVGKTRFAARSCAPTTRAHASPLAASHEACGGKLRAARGRDERQRVHNSQRESRTTGANQAGQAHRHKWPASSLAAPAERGPRRKKNGSPTLSLALTLLLGEVNRLVAVRAFAAKTQVSGGGPTTPKRMCVGGRPALTSTTWRWLGGLPTGVRAAAAPAAIRMPSASLCEKRFH